MPAATTRKRRAADTSQRNSKRLKSDTNGDTETAAANSSVRHASRSDSDSSSDTDSVQPATNDASSQLAALDSTTLTRQLPLRRAHILNRLSGHLHPTSELIDLDDQAATLNLTLQSTIQRGESNSVLLVGPKGSGKSALLQRALDKASDGGKHTFHHVQLSALMCTTDRSAMRELARQLISTGALGLEGGAEDMESRLRLNEEDEDGENSEEDDEDEDVDGDGEDEGDHPRDHGPSPPLDDDSADEDDAKAALGTAVLSSLSSTTSSILSLLASTNAKAAPLIITLDHFDLLTTRPRQALLYCLLDAVQSGTYKPGLAVVGMTRRVDTVDLLEKRVKSRFSHRIVQCYPPANMHRWKDLVRNVLTASDTTQDNDDDGTFTSAWNQEVVALLENAQFQSNLTSTIELSQDVQHLFSILYPVISQLSLATSTITPNQPHLYAQAQESLLVDETIRQLYHLPTLAFLFVIAAKQLLLRDRVVFNFEVAFDEVRRFSQRTRREREGAGTGGMGLNADKGVMAGDDAKQSPKSRRGNAATTSSASSSSGDGSAPSHHPWEDRKKAMMAFEHLLTLEIFLPDAFLSTLASGPTSAGTIATTTTTTDAKRQAAQHTFKTSVNAHSTVRKEYLRVRSVLNSFVVVEVAKERAAKGTLGTEVAQWASRSIA